jgi:hypothetical protein
MFEILSIIEKSLCRSVGYGVRQAVVEVLNSASLSNGRVGVLQLLPVSNAVESTGHHRMLIQDYIQNYTRF